MNMSRGKKTKKKEPRRRQETEKRDRCDDIDQRGQMSTGLGEKLASVFKCDELIEVRTILQKNNLTDVPVLLAAVVLGKFDVVKKLLRETHSIDCFAHDHSTPLMWAVKNKNLEMIDLLIRRGANITLEDDNGDNAVLIALQTPAWDQDSFIDFWNSVKDSDNLDINHSNKGGYTMLHYATKNQWKSVVKYLLDKSVNVNCVTSKGVTPLMMAASRNHDNVVMLLLEANADISLEDERCCTALCYTIAFVVQKRLELPNSTLQWLMGAVETIGSKITLDEYLKRRLHLLMKPPDAVPNFPDIITNVILGVVNFFVRSTKSGLELLLEQRVFFRVTEAIETHLDNTDYTHALLGIMFDLLRYCSCCYGGGDCAITEDEIMSMFVADGGANVCLTILRTHGQLQSNKWLVVAALMPLFSACPSKGHPRAWLQAHYKELLPYHHRFLNMCLIKFNLNADDYHTSLLRRRVKEFRNLMARLERGECVINKHKVKPAAGDAEQENNLQHMSENQSDVPIYPAPEDVVCEQATNFLKFSTCSKKNRRKAAKTLKLKISKMRNLNTTPNSEVYNSLDQSSNDKHRYVEIDSSQGYTQPLADDKLQDSLKNNGKDSISVNVSKDDSSGMSHWPIDPSGNPGRNIKSIEEENSDEEDTKNILKYTADTISKCIQFEQKSSKRVHFSNIEKPSAGFNQHMTKLNGSTDVDIIKEPVVDKCEWKVLNKVHNLEENEILQGGAGDTSNTVDPSSIIKNVEQILEGNEPLTLGSQQQFQQKERIVMCAKTQPGGATKIPPPPFPNLQQKVAKKIIQEEHKDQNDNKMFLQDHSTSMINEEESNITQPHDLTYLNILFQNLLIKYLKLWRREGEEDYPGHHGEGDGSNCEGKEGIVLSKLKNILPELENEYILNLSELWESLTAKLKATENELYISIVSEIKKTLTNYNIELNIRLKQLEECVRQFHFGDDNITKPNIHSNKTVTATEFTLMQNLGSAEESDSNLEDKTKVVIDSLEKGFTIQESAARLLQDVDKNIINDNCEIYDYSEDSYINHYNSILNNLVINQRYDTEYACMSLEDCISAYIGQAKTLETKEHVLNFESESMFNNAENGNKFCSSDLKHKWSDSYHKIESKIHVSRELILQNSIQEEMKNNTFYTLPTVTKFLQCHCNSIQPHKMSYAELFRDKSTVSSSVTRLSTLNSTSISFFQHPPVKQSDNHKSKMIINTPPNINICCDEEVKQIIQPTSGYSQQPVITLEPIMKNQPSDNAQMSSINHSSPVQLFITIPHITSNSTKLTISTPERSLELSQVASPCTQLPMLLPGSSHYVSRWKPLVSALQSMSPTHCHTLSDGALTLSSEVFQSHFKIASGGNFGDVKLGIGNSKSPLAVKCMYLYINNSSSTIGLLLQKLITPLLSLRNEHILPYIQCIQHENKVFVTTPLCEYNLGEYLMCLKLSNDLDAHSYDLVKQFLSGLQFLHTLSSPLIHGDLKPSNVLVDGKGMLKLADFGIHPILYQLMQPPSSSLIWWSRETHESYEHNWNIYCTLKSDIQVAGMLIHFVLTGGLHPFGAEAEDIVINVKKGNPALKTGSCETNDLISWMMVYEPNERPEITDVFRHVYFWDLRKKWQFLLACAGITQDCQVLPLPLSEFHAALDNQAVEDHVKGDWVSVVKANFPDMAPVEEGYSDTPTGLLRFIRTCVEDQKIKDINHHITLHRFFLSAFPALALSLYRLIEETEWATHPVLEQFTLKL